MGEKGLDMATIAIPLFQPTSALTGNQFESGWDYPITSSAALSRPKVRKYRLPSAGIAFKVYVTESADSPETVESSLPTWVEQTALGFMTVRKLPENWDSYGGKRIGLNVIDQSLAILVQIMDAGSPAPSVVPLGDGGLQLEWHRNQQDLEVVFPGDDLPQFYYTDRRVGAELEGPANDVTNLAQLLRSLA